MAEAPTKTTSEKADVEHVQPEFGAHTAGALSVLRAEIGSPEAIASIAGRAVQIIERSVDPIGAPPAPTYGLLYGLIQSGKTSIITVVAAMAADRGFRCIIILTSDIDLLYDQTRERVVRALRGLTVFGKNDWKNREKFETALRTGPSVVVCSKNGKMLDNMLDAFKAAGAKGLPAMIIDDEADQASLNTLTSKGTQDTSRINEVITEIRDFFRVNTYLQVTATPQALFLQRPDHRYRPSFTVLSDPGIGYVGGEAFFGLESTLLREVDLHEVDALRTTHQPAPTGAVPSGLRRALYTFLVGATARLIQRAGDGYAFLCHVSMGQGDHFHIVDLIERFKQETVESFSPAASPRKRELLMAALREAYDDLSTTESNLPEFNLIVERIGYWIGGANVQVINATSSKKDIELDAAYNILVGGNKLGRGVTLRNLLVSYYGRNPKSPNSDTVLQHARMYGYRRADLGVTRLFLPKELARHFELIHQMETALRGLVEKYPDGKFEGLYISSPLKGTRRNVLDPNAIGMYVAGRSYNPVAPLRSDKANADTKWLDDKLSGYDGKSPGVEVSIDLLIELLRRCHPDPTYASELWDPKVIEVALEKLEMLRGKRAYLVVRRNRNLDVPREETKGILSGGEEALAPRDAPTLFMYNQDPNRRAESAVWWPQLRFPEGNYVLAFSFNR